jgi:hypothetical protein
MNGFDDVMILLRLVTDPAATQARLDELQAAIQAAASKETEADAARDALEGERERLAKLEAALRERELKVHGAECKIESDVAELQSWRREQRASRLVEVAPGLTREPDDTPVDPDPITDRYAEPMTQAAVRAAPRHRGRARA